MADPRPEFVLTHNRRGLFHSLFVLCVLTTGWFAVVLVGESQGWGDDPGRWAVFPTFVWALLGLVPFVLFIAYALALLTIREREGQVYRTEDADGVPPATPSFLQPTDAEVANPEGAEPTEAPPQS